VKVEYYHERPGAYTGNIIWSPAKPMRGGKFPADHPAAPGVQIFGEQIGNGKMNEFRARGYWASCFPEGDGITMKCERGQNTAQVMSDIKDVFGWDVLVKRGDE
jgi:hypothetical protein